jgi:hypothetical protein
LSQQPTPSELIRQITSAWENAQEQLAALRSQVERTTHLAQAKVQANFIERDRDRAFRDLGEAVWRQVHAGKLVLPEAVSEALETVRKIEGKLAAQNQEITDILKADEQEEKASAKTSRSGVAQKTKKR